VKADFSFERPIVTAKSVQAMRTLNLTQGRGHVWLVGAYVRYSMPLLENGVKSAIEVAKALGIDVSDVEFDPDVPDNQVAVQAFKTLSVHGSKAMPDIQSSLLRAVASGDSRMKLRMALVTISAIGIGALMAARR